MDVQSKISKQVFTMREKSYYFKWKFCAQMHMLILYGCAFERATISQKKLMLHMNFYCLYIFAKTISPKEV